MSLQKQTKQLVFGQGVDTKTTAELVAVGKLHSAENIRFNQSGKISKKRGSTAFNTSTLAGGTIAAARSCFSHLNGAYAVIPSTAASRTVASTNSAPDDIYGYSPSLDKWTYVSRAGNVTGETQNIPFDFISSALYSGLPQNNSTVDAIYLNGFVITAICNTAVYSRVTILDAVTGETILSQEFGTLLTQFRVVALGNKAIVLGLLGGGGGVQAYSFDTTSLSSTAPTAITFATGAAGGALLFDCFVAPQNGNLYVAYTNNASGINVFQCATLPTSGAATITNSITIAEVAVKALVIFGGESVFQKIYVAYTKSGTGVRLNLSTLTLTGSALSTVTATEANALSGAFATDANSKFVMLLSQYSFVSGGTYDAVTYFGINASTSTSLGQSQYNVALASKIYTLNGQNYVLLVTTDALERTYFLTYATQDTTGVMGSLIPFTKLLFGRAGFQQSAGKSNLPSLAVSGTSVITIGYRYSQQQTPTVALYSPVLLKFNFNNINPDAYQFREISGLTYFTGGVPCCFDGKNFFEASFLHSPYAPDTPVGATSAGLLTLLGTYQVCTVFEFLDSQGNRHQSAPSIPLSFTLTGTQNQFTFQIFPPVVSLHGIINIVVYRTQANGTIFYRCFSTASSNGPATVGTTQSDTSIGTQEILYTAGNVIENQSPTAARGITIWKDRVWYLTDDGIVFSKNITDGFPAAFNPVLNMNTIINKTAPKAIAGVRDKLFAFYMDDTFYTSGDGPSDTGDGAFSPLELAASGVGAISTSAIIETQDLVFFQSRDGWRSISGTLTLAYIGSEIQNYISESTIIYATAYIDSLHEIRIMDGNRTYVYDIFEKQWSVHTAWVDYRGFLWSGIGAANKRYVRLRTDGVLLYEDTTTFLDAASFTAMTVRTGWISMDQFQGFERLYKVILLGRYYTPHSVTLKVFYDFVPQPIETFTFASSAGNFAAFDDTNVYQNDSYTGNGYPFQVDFRPSQQKCQAIRIEITDTFVSGNGQAFDIIGMNLVLGVRNVDAKIRDAAKATGSGRPAFIP